MISVLDMLKFQLARGGPPNEDMPAPSWLNGLPDAVRDSLLNRPTYGEGMVIPGPRNPLMEQERAARLAPQRENDLDANVRYMDYLKRSGMWAMPEGAYGMRLGHEQQPAQPPFASPLNQLMIRPGSRVPAALY